MTTSSDPTGSTTQTPEESRREMKRRFDEANATAEASHQRSRDAGDRAASEDDGRWRRPESAPDLDDETRAEGDPD